MPCRTFKNTAQGTILTVNYNKHFTVTDQYGVTCYTVRNRDINSQHLIGASFTDDNGNYILIINGQSLLQASLKIYVTPPTATITPQEEITPIPSEENIQAGEF